MNYHPKSLISTLMVRNAVNRKDEVASYLVQNRDSVKFYQNKKVGVLLINDKDCQLKRFAHPVFIGAHEKYVVDDTDYVVVDVRGLRDAEASVMERYAQHVAVWESHSIREDFSSLTLLPMISYTNWFSAVFANRYNLTAAESQSVAVFSALFYMLQSKSVDVVLGQDNVNASLNRISQATGMPESNIVEILDTIEDELIAKDIAPNLYTLTHLFKSISPRLEKLITPENILAPLAPTFMGSRGTSIASVATEYPPAFMTMLLTVLEDRSYQRCTLKKVVGERVLSGKYKRLGDEFLRSYVWYNNQYFS